MADLDERIANARQLPHEPAPAPSVRNFSALVDEQVRARGHAPFLTFYGDSSGERTELSYATFGNWVAKTANLLVEELELQRGDRVATLLGNHWTTAVVTFACWKAGCCVVPVDADDPAMQARGLLEASRAETAFVREDLLSELDTLRHATSLRQVVAVGTGMAARLATDATIPDDVLSYGEEVLAFADDYDDPDVDLDDDALLILPPRGGEAPAGVRLTQSNVLAAAEALCDWGLGPDDRLLCAQPVQLVDGLALAHAGPFAAGASVVLTDGADAGTLWRKASDEKATLAQLSPSILDRLVGMPAVTAPEGLRAVLVPAGAARDVTAGAAEQLGLAVRSGHGLVEATSASTLMPAELDEATHSWLHAAEGRAVGAATSRAAVAALAADGTPLPHGRPGRLAVRGPVVMAGYDDDPQANERAFLSGWYATAEQGVADVGPDGRVYAFTLR